MKRRILAGIGALGVMMAIATPAVAASSDTDPGAVPKKAVTTAEHADLASAPPERPGAAAAKHAQAVPPASLEADEAPPASLEAEAAPSAVINNDRMALVAGGGDKELTPNDPSLAPAPTAGVADSASTPDTPSTPDNPVTPNPAPDVTTVPSVVPNDPAKPGPTTPGGDSATTPTTQPGDTGTDTGTGSTPGGSGTTTSDSSADATSGDKKIDLPHYGVLGDSDKSPSTRSGDGARLSKKDASAPSDISSSDTSGEELARTGSDSWKVITVASMLMLLGAGIVALRSRASHGIASK